MSKSVHTKREPAHRLCVHTVPLLLMKGADKKRNKNHFFAMGDRVTFFGQACTVDQEEEQRVAALLPRYIHTHQLGRYNVHTLVGFGGRFNRFFQFQGVALALDLTHHLPLIVSQTSKSKHFEGEIGSFKITDLVIMITYHISCVQVLLLGSLE